jgi:hypothetical protein
LPPQPFSLAILPINPRASSPSLCSRLAFLRARHLPIILPKWSRKATIPFRITSFADPHPLTPIKSYLCKKQGEGVAGVHSLFRLPSTSSVTHSNARLPRAEARCNPFPLMGLLHRSLDTLGCPSASFASQHKAIGPDSPGAHTIATIFSCDPPLVSLGASAFAPRCARHENLTELRGTNQRAARQTRV